MDRLTQRKLFSALCHGAIFFSSTIVSVGIPIGILLTTDDTVVKDNAKESLNFHINLYIYAFIFLLLTIFIIGIPLLVILGIVSIIMPVIAIVRVLDNPDLPYRYPFIFRLF
ncbi:MULTISPECIES: DUF4870 domain-containing protein [Nostocales]|uniref:DUF4870 domain-containing protein n=3 Tax=Nostocales TaxID=1161 RepID=A0A8S9SY21_9CYAN|nr:DUF4870 domain-containing protein [Tolypothrix bouteillei]KAF3885070.1 DUF4870 domain-containing protein [Tolypothrix bouteillei VB521301]